MNSSVKSLLIFLTGVGVGALTAQAILKEKYERIAEEEIESVKKAYGRRAVTVEKVEPSVDRVIEEAVPEISKYKGQEGKTYTKYSSFSSPSPVSDVVKDEPVEEPSKPYLIEPDVFGLFEDYTTEFLTYFADGVVVADDTNLVVEDVEGTIGTEFKDYFGKYESGLVHIRNDELKTDYEIQQDSENFNE